MPYQRIVAISVLMVLLWAACQSNPYVQGERLYNYHCANCHMEDGSGLKGTIPPLAQSDFLAGNLDRVPCIIRYGLADTIVVNGETFSQEMEGIPDLNEYEITNILNYILHTWGTEPVYVPPTQVQEALKNCSAR